MDFKVLIVLTLLIFGIIKLGYFEKENSGNIILNEVCPYNDTILYDTIGNYHDYIEIYNPLDEKKDISGYGLSDDKDELAKYVFAEGTVIEEGDYLLLWAGMWSNQILVGAEVSYTGFSLSAGETVFLTDSEGNVIDKIKIPKEIERDVSYSCISDINHVWRRTVATPGEKNSKQLVEEEKFLPAEVTFSASSGFYEKEFYLELKTENDYDIYYTMDGSEPDVDSTKYEEAILIRDVSLNENKYASVAEISQEEVVYIPEYKVEKATTIRAIAVSEDGLRSQDTCETYFVGYQAKEGFQDIVTISLISDPEDLFGYEDGIYVTGKLWDINEAAIKEKTEYWYLQPYANYAAKGAGWKKNAFVQYFDEEGQMIYNQEIKLGMHGVTSLTKNQKSFNLFGISGKSDYVFPGLFGRNETSLMLRNSGGRDCYSTKLRDGVNQGLVSDRALTTLDYIPCQVFLNGEYWGVYMLQERVSTSMLAEKYSIEEENIVIVKNEQIYAGEEEDITLWTDVVEFAINNDLSVKENYEKIEQMIDIQSSIDHYCFQVYTANRDSISNNNGKWRSRDVGENEYEDGKWRWILYDTDTSSRVDVVECEAYTNSFVQGNYGMHVVEEPLFNALMQNEEYRKQFIISFIDIANYNYSVEKTWTAYDKWNEKLKLAMVESHKRFLREDYTVEDYENEIMSVKLFFMERSDYIVPYMKNVFDLSGDLFRIEVRNQNGGEVYLNTVSIKEAESFWGMYYSDYEISLKAVPKIDYKFKGWYVNEEYYTEEELILPVDQKYTIIPIWDKMYE